MINLQIPPKNPEELYEFFMHIAKPPVKNHSVYIEIFKYIREAWITTGYQEKNSNYRLWFRYRESDSPEWYEVYDKYA